MELLIDNIFMLIFMHFVNTWLLTYASTKTFGISLTVKSLVLISVLFSLITFGLREFIIVTNLPIGLSLIFSILLLTLLLVKVAGMQWGYALIGTLISLITMALWSPIAQLIVSQLGWKYPNDNILINLACGYLEMMGLILFSIYLNVTNFNVFKILPLKGKLNKDE